MRRADSHPAMAPLRLGISACLLGQAVRYDGGHKRDPFLAETLGRFVEWVPVCPEVELGLGVPREPIRLEGDAAAPRLVAAKSRRDLTRAMTRLARARAEQLARLDLVGYVFKKDSPSCGVERVRVHGDGGRPLRRGTGLFARALAYARWKSALAAGMTRGRLHAFHAAHELLLRAHDPAACRRLGTLVADAGKRPLRPLVAEYGAGFMRALRTRARRRRRTHVPEHTLRYLSSQLTRAEPEEPVTVTGRLAARRPGPPAPRRSPTARRAASRPAPRRPRSSP